MKFSPLTLARLLVFSTFAFGQRMKLIDFGHFAVGLALFTSEYEQNE
jgi:hypothetical protein